MAKKRPSQAYSAMFSSLFFGAFLLVTGLIGYDTQQRAKLFADSRWMGRPILWQIAAGTGLVLVGLYLARRLGVFRWEVVDGPASPRIKSVGSGRSTGAARRGYERHLR
jgi:hypothetical protein